LISTKFIKSSLVYSVIGALPLASSIILLPFYTDLLTTDQFGVLTLYIAFTAIMQIMVNFALDQYLGIRWVDFKENAQVAKENVGTAVSLLLIIGVFFVALFALVGSPLFHGYTGFTGNKVVLLFYPWGFMSLLTAIFNSLFKSYTALLIYQERPVRFFWLNIVNFILTIGISLSILYTNPFSLAGPMYGRLLSGLGIFILGGFFFLTEYGISFHGKLLKGIAYFCFPLFIYFILTWVIGNADRYIIGYFLKASDVAIFAFAIQCTMLLDFFQSGLSSAIYPKVFAIWKETNLQRGTPEVNRYFNGYTAITLLIIPVLVIILPLIIPIFVKNKDFYQTFGLLAILFAGYSMSGLRAYFWAPLVYFKQTKVLPRILLIGSVLQIITGIILINYMGLIGAALANFIGKPIQALLMFRESRKVFAYKFNIWKLVLLPIIFSVVVLCSEVFITNSSRIFFISGQFLLAAGMVWIIYRKELIAFLRVQLKR
jgi:O-antigen/teichoic acid export membrane protein